MRLSTLEWVTFACASTTQDWNTYVQPRTCTRARCCACLRIPSLCPSSFTRELSSRSSLCTNPRGNWFMIEPRIQTRPIYILIRRRSQFATRIATMSLYYVTNVVAYIVTNAPRSGHDRTLFTAATRWPSFPARSHRGQERELRVFCCSHSYCSMIVHVSSILCKMRAICDISFFLFFFFFFFSVAVSLPLSLSLSS